MKFRKRPAVVEAEQWWPGRAVPGVSYEEDYVMEDADGERRVRNKPYVVTIHDQRAHLSPGDWVITEPDGIHHYPCKPEIFAATYEPAEMPK